MKIQELIEMYISKEVKEPSRWVLSLVSILKEDGNVRICIDVRAANKAIIPET